MAQDRNQVQGDMERVNQQDEFNAPVVQEQVIIEGQVPVEEQKLEQLMGQGQRVAGQADGAQAQQHAGNIIHQQPEERREAAGALGGQSNERGHAGMNYPLQGHSGYGRGGVAGQGDGAQAQQHAEDIVHQQPLERREVAGALGRQSNERGHAGMNYSHQGHSGYGRGGRGRGGYGRAQNQQSQPGQYVGGRAGPQHWQQNNLGQSLEDMLQQSDNYIGGPVPMPS